jgi:hypothetical protein
MSGDLDTMLQSASESLHRSVDGLPTDDVPHPSPVPRLVAAAVLVVALAASGALLLTRGDDDATTIPGGRDDVPRLVLGGDTGGLAPTGAADQPLTGVDAGDAAALTLYGAGGDDPFADAGLIVVVPGPGGTVDDKGDPVTVRGHQGRISAGTRPGALNLSWEEAPDHVIALGSHGIDRDQLLAVAEGLAVAGRSVTLGDLPATVPDLRQVGRTFDLPFGLTLPIPRSAPGHLAAYQDTAADRFAMVATFQGDADDIAALRWLTEADDEVEVRGHRAWTGAYAPNAEAPGTQLRTVLWEEAPGVVVVVQSSEDERTVLDWAEHLRPATAAEWQALLDDATAGTTPEDGVSGTATSVPAGEVQPEAPSIAEGTYPGGTWRVYADNDGAICAESESGSSGSDTCSGAGSAAVTLHDNGGTPILLFGVLPDGATSVQVAGTAARPEVHDQPGGNPAWTVVLAPGESPAEATFLDAGGGVVSREPIDL